MSLPVPMPVLNTSIQTVATTSIPNVPFYSQFKDITSLRWQKVGCGIASLAMIIDYYKPFESINTLLKQGIASGAYKPGAGWKHKDLVLLSERYGLSGANYDLSTSDTNTAFTQLKDFLKDGPVIVSIHYKFDPKSTIPHLIVIDGITNDIMYYNDPAAKTGSQQISIPDFLRGWKKRFIVIRPAMDTFSVLPTTTA